MKPTIVKKIVQTDQAPKPIGPYSAGVVIGDFVYTAGMIGIIPATGEIVQGGIEAETRQVLENVGAIVKAAGSDFDFIVKTTVFLRDMGDFTRMNSIYAEFFSANPPARSTVQVGALPRGVAVEIEAVAFIPGQESS